MLGVLAAAPSRRRRRAAAAGVGVLEDVQALGVGGHEPVLDAVVDHLDEVPGAVGAAVQVAVLGVGRGSPVRPGVRGAAPTPGAIAAKIGSSRVDRVVLAADHQAVAALEAPDAAAGADVDVVDAALGQRGRARDVVAVVGVAAVDDDVARLEQRGQAVDGRLGDPPAGTITHTARGLASFATRSSSESAPVAPSPARPCTASGRTS